MQIAERTEHQFIPSDKVSCHALMEQPVTGITFADDREGQAMRTQRTARAARGSAWQSMKRQSRSPQIRWARRTKDRTSAKKPSAPARATHRHENRRSIRS